MKGIIQLKTTYETASDFINGLTSQGYEAHRVSTNNGTVNVHFTIDGKTSINYAVTLFETCAFIGIRPE